MAVAVQLLYKRDKEGREKEGESHPPDEGVVLDEEKRRMKYYHPTREKRHLPPGGHEGLGGNCSLEVPVQLPYKRGNPTPRGRCVEIALERAGSSTIACRRKSPASEGIG